MKLTASSTTGYIRFRILYSAVGDTLEFTAKIYSPDVQVKTHLLCYDSEGTSIKTVNGTVLDPSNEVQTVTIQIGTIEDTSEIRFNFGVSDVSVGDSFYVDDLILHKV